MPLQPSEIKIETCEEARTLVEVYEDIRSLTKFFIAQATDVDPYRVLELNGQRLNSLYWIIGHLVWSEHFLILQGVGNESLDIEWLERFERGSELLTDASSIAALPSMEELQIALDRVHARAMELIGSMTADQLAEPNNLGIRFASGDAKRVIIRHALRHEPMHIGQITWLTKAAGGPTV